MLKSSRLSAWKLPATEFYNTAFAATCPQRKASVEGSMSRPFA